MRRRVYAILFERPAGDGVARTINVLLLLLIAANVTASVIETDVHVRQRAPELFVLFERISVAIFTVEYVARLWSCAEDSRGPLGSRVRFAISPMALVDLAAILPFYIELLFPGTLDLRFLRVLRLLRVFRLMRIPSVGTAFAAISRVVAGKRVELAITLAVVMVAMLMSAGLIFAAERGQPGTQFTSIPHAMWWSIVTITTIGYGDMVPATAIGKLIGGFVGFIGICAIALPVGILSSGFVEEINRRRSERDAAPGTCPTCGRCDDAPSGHP